MDIANPKAVCPDYCFAEWRDVFIILWRKQTTMEGVERLMELCNAFAAERPHFFLLTVVEMNAPLPEAKVRERLATFLAQHGQKIKRSAVVFEGSGFRAAAVRGVVTGLTMLARMPYPHKVFAASREAAGWMRGDDDPSVGGLDSRELLSALADLRGGLPAELRTGT
jgi:hypothetical protein